MGTAASTLRSFLIQHKEAVLKRAPLHGNKYIKFETYELKLYRLTSKMIITKNNQGVKIMTDHRLCTLIWVRMARFVQHSNRLSNEFLKQYGLTAAQFDVLSQIQAAEPLTQQELAQRLTVTNGGISRMLARLEQEGLIIRKQKWREKHIELSPKGKELLAEVVPQQVQFQATLFNEVLSAEEKKELYRLVTKLQKHSLQKLNEVYDQ